PDCGFAATGNLATDFGRLVGGAATGQLPESEEGMVERPGRRTPDHHCGVAPRLTPLGRVAGPLIADAQPASDRLIAVDHQQLAMVARDELHRSKQVGRAKGVYFGPGVPQPFPELAPGATRPE